MDFVSRWPSIGGVLLLLFIAVSPLMPLDGLRLLLLLLLFAGALLYCKFRGDWSEWRIGSWTFLPWVAWAGLSIAWSADPGYSAYYWLNEVLMTVFVFLLGTQLARQKVDTKYLFVGFALMLLLLAVISGMHVVFPLAVPLYYPGWLDNEPQATAYLVMGLSAACWWILRRSLVSKCIGLLLLIAIHVVAWVALKRSPYLALMAQVTVLLFVVQFRLNRNLVRYVVPVLIVFLIATLVLAIQVGRQRPASYAAGASAQTGLAASFTQNERYQTWSFWFDQGAAHPWLGVGVGRYLPNHVYVNPKTSHVDPWFVAHGHNVFLNQWLQLGFFGVATYVFLWGRFFVFALKRLTAVNCQYVRILSGLMLSALLAMLVRNGTDDLLFGSCGALWWLALGYLQEQIRVSADSSADALPAGPEIALVKV